jgi:Transglutaminase-like superfamily
MAVIEKHLIFRVSWWSTNLLLVVAAGALIYSGGWEYSVRQYLKGFSDAIVPATARPEQQVEAILNWMRNGPPRPVAANPAELALRDPETTLNYRQLLAVCGTATNAFLNLSRSAGLDSRRLLLLMPDHTTKHVVAEVPIDGRWVVVDPSYRLMFRDFDGRLLTRKELQNPAVFAQATSAVPKYPPEYTYERFAHVRVSRLPLAGAGMRWLLDAVAPGWDELVDWTLLLERESYSALVAAAVVTFFSLVLRFLLAWYADYRLRIPRFHLREHFLRAGAAFFGTPGIK